MFQDTIQNTERKMEGNLGKKEEVSKLQTLINFQSKNEMTDDFQAQPKEKLCLFVETLQKENAFLKLLLQEQRTQIPLLNDTDQLVLAKMLVF